MMVKTEHQNKALLQDRRGLVVVWTVLCRLCGLFRPMVKTYWQAKTVLCHHWIKWAPQTVAPPRRSLCAVTFTKLVFTAGLSFTNRMFPRPEHKAIYQRVGNPKLSSTSNRWGKKKKSNSIRFRSKLINSKTKSSTSHSFTNQHC